MVDDYTSYPEDRAMRPNESDKARIDAAVRTAAIVAAKGAPLGEDALNRIVAETNSPGMGEAQRMTIAASLAEKEVGINKPINASAATPRELALLAETGDFAAQRYLLSLKQGRPAAGTDDSTQLSSRGGNQFAALDPNVAKARDLALAKGMEWAANNPELLRLGPSAIQALADVKLREDSYKRFKSNVGLDDKTIVNTARYAKKHDIDANKFSEDAAEVNKELTPAEREEHKKAIGRLVRPGQTPAEEEQSRKDFNGTMERFKKRHPHLRDKIEREQETMKTKQRETVKNERKAKVAKSENDDLLASINSPTLASVEPPAKAVASKPPEPAKEESGKLKARQLAASSKPSGIG